MRHKTQKFDGRRYRVDDILSSLGILTGMLTVNEAFNTMRPRYPNTWMIRVIISMYRMENSVSAYGIGYGFDWKGVRRRTWPDGTVETKEMRPLKCDVEEFLESGIIPYHVMSRGARHIQERELIEWAVQHALIRKKQCASRARGEKRHSKVARNGHAHGANGYASR